MFEVRDKDLAGRIGRLEVGDERVETPTIMPVINPNLETVDPSRLPEFGAEIAITNAYVLYRDENLRRRVLDEGLRSVVDFPGPLMTDSGSYQLSVYGDLEVSSQEIVEFQLEAGSDLITPLDLPTPPDANRSRAESELEITTERIEEARKIAGEKTVAPIQGSTYPELREEGARLAASTGSRYLCVGALVPLMERYRYRQLVDCVIAAKRGLPESVPVHLFGAGHPSFFSLAVAMGADLFDSAAYALFARERRYLTAEGTRFVEEMEYLPCSCSACADREPDEMEGPPLVEHNLHATFEELRTVKQALREGRLTELAAQRARTHPRLLDGWRRYLEKVEWIEERDPAVKRKGMLYTGDEAARRPEVRRHLSRLGRLELENAAVVAPHDAELENYPEDATVLRVKPPFVYPEELSETYPSGQSVVPEDPDPETIRVAEKMLKHLIEDQGFEDVYFSDFEYEIDSSFGDNSSADEK